MYDTNAAARRLTAILGVKPSKKPLIRSYLQEAYASALKGENECMGIADTVIADEHFYNELSNKSSTEEMP